MEVLFFDHIGKLSLSKIDSRKSLIRFFDLIDTIKGLISCYLLQNFLRTISEGKTRQYILK